MQFLVVAHDGTDDQALERRMAVREDHLEGARKRAASGMTICGGALLDDDGKIDWLGLQHRDRKPGRTGRLAGLRPLRHRQRLAVHHGDAVPPGRVTRGRRRGS